MKEKSQRPSRQRTERFGKFGNVFGMSMLCEGDENEKGDMDNRHAQKIVRSMHRAGHLIFICEANGGRYLKMKKANMATLMISMVQKTS